MPAKNSIGGLPTWRTVLEAGLVAALVTRLSGLLALQNRHTLTMTHSPLCLQITDTDAVVLPNCHSPAVLCPYPAPPTHPLPNSLPSHEMRH